MNTLNQENESPWIKLWCLPAPFSIEYQNYKFHIPFILMYNQKTNILQLKSGQSIKKYPQITRWCHENGTGNLKVVLKS